MLANTQIKPQTRLNFGLERLLGQRPASIRDGAAALLERVRAREVTAVDLLPYAAGQIARHTQLVGPAMGRLATSHLPAL